MTYQTFKCPCGDTVCDKWMVSPGADFQGCGWDKKTAQAVTDFLNNNNTKIDWLCKALRIYALSLRGSHATRNDIANELDALAKEMGK